MTDASLNFGEAAERYQTYRPDYPETVFAFLQRRVASGRDLAVDLGAGTGQATRRLAGEFRKVIAIEPDARLAHAASWPDNAEIRVIAAEDAELDAGSVDAVIAATSFHWMNQAQICRHAARWLKPGGAFFPFAFDAFRADGAAAPVYDSEFAKWAGFRDRRLIENYDYEKALRGSGAFARVIPFRRDEVFTLRSEIAVGLISTFSYARAYAVSTGDPDRYFDGLTDRFRQRGETVTLVAPVKGAIGIVA